MIELMNAIGTILDPLTMFMLLFGTFFGVMVGAIPGLGTTVAITICIPFTLSMGSGPAIALLLGVYASSIFGGSIAAILLNTPGTPQSACTGFDGYAMAKNGKANEALGWALTASVFGGLFSCAILIIAAPQLAEVSVKYGGPLEICAFICVGLACVTAVSEKSHIKGIIMALAGLLLATIGLDAKTGVPRFTFGTLDLMSGFDIMPVCVGMYPLAEIFYRIYEVRTETAPTPIECKRVKFPSIKQLFLRLGTLIRSSLLGTGIGILPGTGATAATFVGYTVEKRFSSTPEEFGKGRPEGIAAAESANNAVSGGAMVPTLALGIPGEPTMALMLATFMLHGITPGIRLMADNPDVVYSTFMALILANIILIPCTLIVVRIFAKIIKIPTGPLLAIIAICSIVGVYLPRGNMFDVWAAIVIGLLTFGGRFLHFPVAPFIIAFVLGPQLEYRFSQIVMFKGDSGYIEYLLTSPLATGLFMLAGILFITPIIMSLRDGNKHNLNECR